MEETPFTLRVKKQTPINSTGNEPYGCRTPAVELETDERLVRLVKLSPPPSIVEYPTFGNEGALGWAYAYSGSLFERSLGLFPGACCLCATFSKLSDFTIVFFPAHWTLPRESQL